MASIYTRKAVTAIVNDENLTPDEKTERLFTLYGQALDDGYLSKSQAQAMQNAAVEAAKAEAIKGYQAPDVKESEEYKALQKAMDEERAKFKARDSEDFKGVKPKFFDTVYGMIDRNEGAKPIADQLKSIGEKYEEYFIQEEKEATPPASKPSFGAETQGSAPTGKTGPSFMDTWGYVPKK